MALKVKPIASIILALVASSAGAQGVLTERNISLAMAKIIGETALDACRKDGSRVTVVVLDRAGKRASCFTGRRRRAAHLRE